VRCAVCYLIGVKSLLLKTMFLQAVHKYICIYLYTFRCRPGTTRKLQNPPFILKFCALVISICLGFASASAEDLS
jgi:hypothetical protein